MSRDLVNTIDLEFCEPNLGLANEGTFEATSRNVESRFQISTFHTVTVVLH